jgi:hypothetical protein
LDTEIKNLNLIDPNIDAGFGSGAGSLVGLMEFGAITKCNVLNGHVSGFSVVGGIAGHTFVTSVVDCYVEAAVLGLEATGGLVGVSYAGVVENCSSAGTVAGIAQVGGSAGVNDYLMEFGLFIPGFIAGCRAEGEVDGLFSVGGLVGDNFAVVVDSYAVADVIGTNRVGGLVGHNYLWPETPFSPEIIHCYSTGAVTGDENTGGLVGANEGGTVTASFWDRETSGLSNSAGGTGITTAQMQRKSTFTNAGWDFADETSNGDEDIWWIVEGEDYPRLFWELAEAEPNEPNQPGEPNEPDEPDEVLDPLSEAVDTKLSFTTGGDAVWFSQTETSYHDGDAAQSGDITHDQESWLQTTVSGEGTLRFYWKASSEGNSDDLEFYVDGSRQERISGSKDWDQIISYVTGSGAHTIEWRYIKDGSITRGEDCGWVDQVEWAPAP